MTSTDASAEEQASVQDRDRRPHVVIVGAGFAGLACARALGGAPARVTVIDRKNFHLFVPLLYQVATAALSPADIAAPVRRLLARHPNVSVVLGDVQGVDTSQRRVQMADGRKLHYDRLVLATGSTYNYFGHEDWAAIAPGPRTLEDARHIRSRLLMCFERAEATDDTELRAALLTIIVVGGGPTGVEMAGSVAELARHALARDFRRIDPLQTRILLIEAGPRILSAFPESLAAYAHRELERLGVTVRTGETVERLDPDGATVAGRPIRAGTVIWGAGVQASPAAAWIHAEADRAGRITVAADLSVPGHPQIFALGDTAAVAGPDGRPLPALAQVAKQQGQHLGKALKANLLRGVPMRAFRFRNRGNAAIIGRRAAIFDFGRWRLKGSPAWVLWAVLHIYLLSGFDKRVLVAIQWLWDYLTYQRGARLIMDDTDRGTVDRRPR